MANILKFYSRADVTPQKNLENFIFFCKNELTYFSPDFNWTDNHWPKVGAIFNKMDTSIIRSTNPEDIISQPLLEFSKAYVRYHLGVKNNPRVRYELTIFRCVEKALIEFGKETDIAVLTPAVLDRATEIARERYTASSMYHIGRQLQFLAGFLSKNNLIPNYLDWKNPVSRPNDRIRTGGKAEREREKKLLKEDALYALADVFASDPKEHSDIFVTSVCAIMLCVPCRISEVLALHVNCEVYENRRDGSKAYGIRFLPGKGAPPQIKWVPSTMVSIAQEAIKRLKNITNEARKIALWYEANPDRLYRHSKCPNFADDEYLTAAQCNEVLGYDGNSTKNKFSTISGMHNKIIKQLPSGFPYLDKDREIKYSEALFCLQRNQLALKQNKSKVQITKATSSNLLERISRTDKKRDINFFESHGYKDIDGKPISITSHQFRHLLNTMAQRGGMSQIEIARWSGRTNIQQNRIYDHMSEFEIVDMLRRHDPNLSLDSSMEELRLQIAKKIPISQQEFNTLAMPAAHITEIGYCIHDYAMSPCQKHLDCFNCNEQVCVKGDARLKNVQEIYNKNKELLIKMEADIVKGLAGADRWYEHTKMTLQRAEELLKILNDPTIPTGSIIKLYNPNEFSPTIRALKRQDKNKLGDRYKEMLEQTRLLMDE